VLKLKLDNLPAGKVFEYKDNQFKGIKVRALK